MKRCFPLLCLLAALATVPLAANAAPGFYSATIAVNDHSPGERNRAMGEALGQVLIRLTGRADIGAEPAAAALLGDAPSYALEFGYVDLEEAEGQGLRVSFTAAEIDEYLRRHRLPVWPLKRPPLLGWMLMEAAGSPAEFVTPEDDPALYSELTGLFDARGLPVRYPVYDLEDQLNLPVEQGWQFNVDQLAMASGRYGADRWLVVRCFETSGGDWRLAWMLGGEDHRSDLRSLTAEELDAGLGQVVGRAVDRIAAESAYIPAAEARGLAVEVSGIADYASYRDLIQLISELSVVKSHRLTAVAGDRIALDLEVDGDRQLFVDALVPYRQLTVAGPAGNQGPVALAWRAASR